MKHEKHVRTIMRRLILSSFFFFCLLMVWKPATTEAAATISYGGYTYKTTYSYTNGEKTNVYRKKGSSKYQKILTLKGVCFLQFGYANRLYYNYTEGSYETYDARGAFGYINLKTIRAKVVKSNMHCLARKGNRVLVQQFPGSRLAPLKLYLLNLKTGKWKLISSKTHNGCATIASNNRVYYGYVVKTVGSTSTIRMYRCTLNGTGKKRVSGNIYNVWSAQKITPTYMKYSSDYWSGTKTKYY